MTFSNFFLGFSSALALLFAVEEFSSVRLSSKNWYLGGVFLFLFSFLLQSFLWASGLLRVYPHLLHTHVPTTLLIGFFRKIPIAYVGESSRKIQLVLTEMLTSEGCGYSFFAALPYACK